jgi:diguanylate cyclase (GGDEF)-like protein
MSLKIKRISVYVSLAGFWLAVHFSFVAVAAFIDVQRETRRFTQAAAAIYAELAAEDRGSRDAVRGLAAFAEAQGVASPEIAAGYARGIFAAHPQMSWLGVARKINGAALLDELVDFVELDELDWFLTELAFPAERLGATGYAWVLAESRDGGAGPGGALGQQLDPILPRIQDSPGGMVGLALRLPSRGRVAALAQRIVDSQGEGAVVALFKPRGSLAGGGDRSGLRVTLGVPGAHSMPVVLLRDDTPPPSVFETALFPLLRFEGRLEGPPGSVLLIERQLDASILDRARLGAIFGVACLFLVVFVRHAKALRRHELLTLEEGNLLFQRANFDALTGLPNRQLFGNRLEQTLTTARRTGQSHALLFLDLDGFKQVNDFYGHEIGDKVLQRAARIFQRHVRDMDTVARLGGDEFAILLYGISNHITAEMVARKIKKAFQRPPDESDGVSKPLPQIGASVGIAIYPDNGESPAELLRAADQAMYRDKAARKSRPPPLKLVGSNSA